MQKNNKFYLLTAVLGLFITTAVVSVGASAHFGYWGNSETKEAAKTAIEAGDYEAWQEAVVNHPKVAELTEGDFDIMTELHQLKQAGDFEGAKVLAEESGFKFGHMGKMKGHFMSVNHEAIKAAVDSGDYQAWAELMTDKPEEFVTEENFNTMVEIHQLMADGDWEAVKELKANSDFGHKGWYKGFKAGWHLEK